MYNPFKIFSRKSATNSHELMQLLLTGGDSDAGISVNSKTAMKYAAIFSAVRGISEAIGMMPLSLYKESGNSKEKATTHKLHHVISVRPNNFQTALEFWEMCGAMVAGRGNFYAFINRVNGEVRELLPIDPDTVENIQNADYSISHKVKMRNGDYEIFGQNEIFHIKLFSLDGVNGVNPITYARNTIGLGMAADKQTSKFFKNGSKPDGILSTEQTLKGTQATEIQEQWDERHGGAANAFKISVLGSGTKYQPISIDPKDAQMIESRRFQRTEIAAMWNYPLHRLGDLENAHHSNMESAGQEFITYCLMPYLTRIEQRIRISLLSEKDSKNHYAKFNASALARGNMEARAQFYTSMIQNGIISPNEAREKEDYSPRNGGDVYLTPLNMAIDGKPVEATGQENAT